MPAKQPTQFRASAWHTETDIKHQETRSIQSVLDWAAAVARRQRRCAQVLAAADLLGGTEATTSPFG
jgi:hypothetical protein